ncbi:MAG TPA: alpha-hydroxy acid oxidase [Ktedonobacteraceae bacterium]|nr:alpha-hydroxy acid oxidase [Ktedonobacteraceae bacterium]
MNLFEYEVLASKYMEPAIWDYYQGGSDDEVTLKSNRASFERLHLRPRVLVDVTTIDMHTTVQGVPISMPIMIAPTAFHRLVHTEGECATVRAAGNADTVMVASTFSTCSLEETARAACGPLWFQLYVYRDLHLSQALVQRAEASGYRAIVLTVDAPRLGRRERDIHNAFTVPASVRIANFARDLLPDAYIPEPAVITWDTVKWLRSITSLPVLLKGILTADDALLACEHGIDGIIVSNHGGRQLDGAVASIDALPEIVQAVAGKCEVYMDGGIRRGTDVLKALALGARAVLIGRPVLWGLAMNGSAGVQHVLELLRSELSLAMTLAGCPALTEIRHSLIQRL